MKSFCFSQSHFLNSSNAVETPKPQTAAQTSTNDLTSASTRCNQMCHVLIIIVPFPSWDLGIGTRPKWPRLRLLPSLKQQRQSPKKGGPKRQLRKKCRLFQTGKRSSIVFKFSKRSVFDHGGQQGGISSEWHHVYLKTWGRKGRFPPGFLSQNWLSQDRTVSLFPWESLPVLCSPFINSLVHVCIRNNHQSSYRSR